MPENSGGSCNYYVANIDHPWDGSKPFKVQCGEVIEALDLTIEEANIFKEIWRTATGRLGISKQGHTNLRAAEKMVFFSNRILTKAKRNDY